MGVFVVQGMISGVIGIVAGIVGGMLLAENISQVMHFIENMFGFQLMPSDVYYISDLPSELKFADVLRIGLVSFVFATIATLYPAWRAARTQPAEALRYE